MGEGDFPQSQGSARLGAVHIHDGIKDAKPGLDGWAGSLSVRRSDDVQITSR